MGKFAGDLAGSVATTSDGNRIALGSPYSDAGGTDAGQVRVFDWNGSTWVQVGADINGEAAGDMSGWAHAISFSADGSRIAIGAPFNDVTDFGAVLENKTSEYTIKNMGTAFLKINSISITGLHAGDFSAAVGGAPFPISIAANSERSLHLTFTPKGNGIRSAIVTINSNNPNKGAYSFAVRGTGTPEIAVRGNRIGIIDGDKTPQKIDFTDFGSSTSPIKKVFQVFNIGKIDLRVTEVKGTSEFIVKPDVAGGFTLQPGDSIDLEITFSA